MEQPVSRGEANDRRGGVWQPRFWEHCCRDEEDTQTRLDYIHFNPVKHGYVRRAIDWPHSTMHRYVREGRMDPRWGSLVAPPAIALTDDECGEPL